MPNYVASIVIDEVIDALAAFILPFVNNSEIVRAQVNRVPAPSDPYVRLTEMMIVDLETPSASIDTVSQVLTITGPAQINIQVDFYSPQAGDWCKAVKGVYRTPYAADMFPANIKPLYCSDGIQGALITGEEQYESRWTLTASLQYNPSVSIPQQSATELAVNKLEDIP